MGPVLGAFYSTGIQGISVGSYGDIHNVVDVVADCIRQDSSLEKEIARRPGHWLYPWPSFASHIG